MVQSGPGHEAAVPDPTELAIDRLELLPVQELVLLSSSFPEDVGLYLSQNLYFRGRDGDATAPTGDLLWGTGSELG